MQRHEGNLTSLAILVLVASVVGLVMIAGCATTRQSVDIRYEVPADGKAVAVVSYSLVTK